MEQRPAELETFSKDVGETAAIAPKKASEAFDAHSTD
jgi:hypothetical protein